MGPTEELKAEHREILLMLGVMNSISERLESGESVDPDQLEAIVDFIRVFADSCHHAKEEGLLFKELEACGMPADSGPIAVMLSEHDIGRSFVRGMSDAVRRYRGGDPGAAKDVADNARKYVALLGAHIQKEDNILYPMADDRLSTEAQERLKSEFERVETEVVGPGKHEQYHKLVHSLRDQYLT